MLPRYKIDATRSRWFEYAVYELKWGIWWKVLESNYMSRCEAYVEQALKLPKYFPAP